MLENVTLGRPDLLRSFAAWNTTVTANTPSPKLFGGGLSFKSNGTGYIAPTEFHSTIQQVQALHLSSFGGVMLWDGDKGCLPNSSDCQFVQTAKQALLGKQFDNSSLPAPRSPMSVPSRMRSALSSATPSEKPSLASSLELRMQHLLTCFLLLQW